MNCRGTLASIGAAAVLTACGGSSFSVSDPSVTDPTNHVESWMKPQRMHGRLIYVSEGHSNEVSVFSFETRELVGQLTGFDKPRGICTDKAGNVYVTNMLGSDVLEYARGGTSPIQTFEDSGEYPIDCDVNRFGELVVANEGSTDGGPGGLSYFEGTRSAQVVHFARLPKVTSIGYLPAAGFNFMTGLNAEGKPQYAKYRFALNLLPTPVRAPGGVRYSGIKKLMAVGDRSGIVYLVDGTSVAKTIQLNGLCAAGQFSITHKFIIVPDPCGGRVLIFPFPGGGVADYQLGGLNDAVGTAVSEDGLRGP